MMEDGRAVGRAGAGDCKVVERPARSRTCHTHSTSEVAEVLDALRVPDAKAADASLDPRSGDGKVPSALCSAGASPKRCRADGCSVSGSGVSLDGEAGWRRVRQ